ncbi:energy transducer TonB [Paludibacter sp. 221]|uniref:energy transducer TonB n=1 Tax=Paludibacter sp. 221 TaxID=2302939 RepID=UPI0013D01148|nr:energy transducer TonB [Paludibacter sp. 221]NDV47213.1 energy transducer TonB [Paludibacter sp. 221]
MVSKKSPKANLESKKALFLMLGLVATLTVLYVALEWSSERTVYVSIEGPEVPVDVIDVPQTAEVKPPPPPPPPKPEPPVTDYKEVSNDTETKDNNFTSELNPDEKIIIPPYVEPIIEDDPDDTFVAVEEMPSTSFNLNEFLSKNLRYPVPAIEGEIEGKVICQFIVNKDGSITDIQIVRGVDPLLDKEAVRVIKAMPKWNPGKQRDKAVKVKCTLPIIFRLSSNR